MESRELLSATWQDLAVATGHSDASRLISAQVFDGGYVSLTSLDALHSRNLFAGVAGDSNGSLQWTNGAGYTVSLNGAFLEIGDAPAGVISFNADGTFTTLIPAVSFSEVGSGRFDDLGAASPASPTYVLIEQGEEVFSDNDEGGAIPINPLLSQLSSITEPSETQRQSLARTSLESEGGQIDLAAMSAPPADQIAGEWARAIAFEIVDDEPTARAARAGRSNATASLDSTIASEMEERLTVQEAQRGRRVHSDSSASENAAAVTHNNGAPSENDLGMISPGIGGLADGAMSIMGGAAPQIGAALHTSRSMASALRPAAAVGTIADLAIAEIFGGPAHASDAAIPPIADVRQWDPWSATPLLLIVALERLSASNSRRANGDESREPRPTVMSLTRRRAPRPADNAVK